MDGFTLRVWGLSGINLYWNIGYTGIVYDDPRFSYLFVHILNNGFTQPCCARMIQYALLIHTTGPVGSGGKPVLKLKISPSETVFKRTESRFWGTLHLTNALFPSGEEAVNRWD